MAVTPGGDKLVVRSGTTVRILARDMNVVSSFEMPTRSGCGFGNLAASEEFIYTIEGSLDMRCFTHDGTEVTKYDVTDEDPDGRTELAPVFPVLAPGGLLFCVLYDMDDSTQDEIIFSNVSVVALLESMACV